MARRFHGEFRGRGGVVAWIGGGCTLYTAAGVLASLPFAPEQRGSWLAGWDVVLCGKLRAAGGHLFVSRKTRAEHRCPQVRALEIKSPKCAGTGWNCRLPRSQSTHRRGQRVPREVDAWTGDCWKAWVRLRAERPTLPMVVVETDMGVGVIYPDGKTRPPECHLRTNELTWKRFTRHRREWLNLVPPAELPETLFGSDGEQRQ